MIEILYLWLMMTKKNSGGFGETVRTVVLAVTVALGVRTVAFEPFNIPSGSMIPTLLIGDYLFVSKASYGYSQYSLPLAPPLFSGRVFESLPQQGDVAVFKLPSNPKIDYIKRVIGLPGDRIQMRGGHLFINEQEVPRQRVEDYVARESDGSVLRFVRYVETLPNGIQHHILEINDSQPYDNTRVFTVPPGHYFMMGDNRDNSADSRADVGFVPLENFVGRADALFFSTDGSAQLWEVWKWPFAVRWERLFNRIRPLNADTPAAPAAVGDKS